MMINVFNQLLNTRGQLLHSYLDIWRCPPKYLDRNVQFLSGAIRLLIAESTDSHHAVPGCLLIITNHLFAVASPNQ